MEQDWQRILAWCERRAPRTFARVRGPADPAALARVEAVTGGRWSEELRQWYRLQDGTEEGLGSWVLPGYAPLPLSGVLRSWLTYQQVMNALVADGTFPDTVGELERQPAGDVAWMFLPSYLPIAATNAATELFVDRRPGPRTGCVREYLREDADRMGVRWESLGAMLADVADCLERRRPSGHWLPVVEDGCLDWVVVGADEASAADGGWGASLPVDERPDDPERAEEEIRSVFAQVFTGHHADAEVLAGVDDGLSLAGVLAEARAQQPDATSSARVDVAEVRFLSRTRAAVAFRIGWSLERGPRGGTRGHVLPFARRRAQLDSGATFAGTAVLVDGAWKVSRSSYCDVLRLTGAQC